MTMALPRPELVLTRCAEQVAPALDRAVAALAPEIRPAVEHHLAGGGKRVRAALALVGTAAAGQSATVGLPGAVAIELVHNFSLLHDDIIDGDTERRHRPTVWAAFGSGQAIIAGDALATLALEVLLDGPEPERPAAAARLAGATQQMIAGQAADMAFEQRSFVGLEECLAMVRGKTGALLSCAAALGPILAGAEPEVVEALSDFGLHLGIAFQAVDDLLGIWGDPSATGKPAGNDLLVHKKSLPVVVALAATDRRAELAVFLAGDLGPGDVARAAHLVEATGARRQVAALADEHLGTALAALGRVTLEPVAQGELEAIAHFVTERDR